MGITSCIFSFAYRVVRKMWKPLWVWRILLEFKKCGRRVDHVQRGSLKSSLEVKKTSWGLGDSCLDLSIFLGLCLKRLGSCQDTRGILPHTPKYPYALADVCLLSGWMRIVFFWIFSIHFDVYWVSYCDHSPHALDHWKSIQLLNIDTSVSFWMKLIFLFKN